MDAVAPRGDGRDHRHHSAGEVSANDGGCHRRCWELRFPGYVLRVHRTAGGAEGTGRRSPAGQVGQTQRAECAPVSGDPRESRAARKGVWFLKRYNIIIGIVGIRDLLSKAFL